MTVDPSEREGEMTPAETVARVICGWAGGKHPEQYWLPAQRSLDAIGYTELLAEVGRLREALRRIARMATVTSTGWGGDVGRHACNGATCHVCVATAALAPSPIEGAEHE